MIKKGDTLIEVTIAVGIFSMIAIAIVSVMSNGVASAQTSLEATLTRQEIDTQAEALRFIHSSYIASTNKSSNKYEHLWSAIIAKAIDLKSKDTEAEQAAILQYSPSSCDELYSNSSPTIGSAFIINTRELSKYSGGSNTENVIVNNSKLKPAATYPHLVYGTSGDTESTLLDRQDSLYAAEGIYIIAVKDNDTTTVGGNNAKAPAFYDFYIRTCWVANRSSDSSTISTVMRLYDPSSVSNN